LGVKNRSVTVSYFRGERSKERGGREGGRVVIWATVGGMCNCHVNPG